MVVIGRIRFADCADKLSIFAIFGRAKQGRYAPKVRRAKALNRAYPVNAGTRYI